MIQVVVRITPELEALVEGIRDDIRGGIRAGMGNLLGELEAHSVREAPVDTSDLVNSITTYMADSGLAGTLKATAAHARYVHEGTRPHVILPRKKKALFWPGAGHPVRKVKHPGTKPNPFFVRAISKAGPQSAFEEGLANYLIRRRR